MGAREKEIYKVTLTGTAVNAVLVVLKLVAGILGRSSAMIADAVHSLSDFVTDIIVLLFVRISGKPLDSDHEYGHGKYETFASMIIGAILIAAGIGLMYNGIRLCVESINGRELPEPTWIALGMAIVSIISKEWLYRYTIRRGKALDSSAVMANAWHHRSDAFSSMGTLVGIVGAMFLGASWRILDPIAAIIVSLLIVRCGYEIMKPNVNQLLEASLSEQDKERITTAVLSVPGIRAMHRLRTRRVGNVAAIDLHAKMDGNITLSEAHAIASEAEKKLRDLFGPASIINIHMEPANKE